MSEVPVDAGVGDVTPATRRTGRPHFDAVASIAAIFISAVSLYVAIEHGKTERELVAANVWPFPRAILSNGYDDKSSVAIGVSNGGVGPAKIRSYELFYRKQPISSGLDLLRKCCGLREGQEAVKAAFPNGTSNSIVDETVLRPGEDNPVLRVPRSVSAPAITEKLAQINVLTQITFKVCYCSVLDQCWISDLRSTRTQPVRQCTAPRHPYDPNGP
ncbi:MAG TPA: hypothetical protein VHS33_08690 [Sphingomicrobium sp.]|jgi:hypothetical protein|nr:hypothetical protein [Sphingomicrobium sp.]